APTNAGIQTRLRRTTVCPSSIVCVHTGHSIFVVHESRLVEVSGDPLPAKLKTRGIPWQGRSAAELAFPAVIRYQEAARLAVSRADDRPDFAPICSTCCLGNCQWTHGRFGLVDQGCLSFQRLNRQQRAASGSA